jgi:hypothetical protein
MVWRAHLHNLYRVFIVNHRPVEKFPVTAPALVGLSPGRDALVTAVHRYGKFPGMPVVLQ